jgi:hypothetical protein
MPLRTKIYQLLPWKGGLNTSQDPALIQADQLVQADNVYFANSGERIRIEGTNYNWDSQSNGSATIIGGTEFNYWDGSNMIRRQVAVSSTGTIYSYDSSGTRTTLSLDGSATAWTGTLTQATFITFNNVLVICVDGSTNVVRMWDPKNDANVLKNLPGTPPLASMCGQHQGRLLLNDKSRRDRLHWSPPFDHTLWQGIGDSGATDLGLGDGDLIGITSIFPTFKGDLFISKWARLYRITGVTGEDHQVSLVSSSIGCSGPNARTGVGQDDIFWFDARGIHSLQAVANYGDFSATNASIDIQHTINNDLDRSRFHLIQATYLDGHNAVAFAVTENSSFNRTLTTTSQNNAIYWFNMVTRGWYRWSDKPCSSIWVGNDFDKRRLYLGTANTRVVKTFNGTNYDISYSGAQVSVTMTLKTGQILLDGSPYTIKGLKRFGVIYRSQGNDNIQVQLKCDNIGVDAENQLTFANVNSLYLLGTTFILGTSTLGSELVLGSYVHTIDGQCRSVQVTITESTASSAITLQGFFIEFEPEGPNQEAA